MNAVRRTHSLDSLTCCCKMGAGSSEELSIMTLRRCAEVILRCGLPSSRGGDELFSDFPEVTRNVTSEPCDVAEIVGHRSW